MKKNLFGSLLLASIALMLTSCSQNTSDDIYESLNAVSYSQNDDHYYNQSDYDQYEITNSDTMYENSDRDIERDSIVEITDPDFNMKIQEIQTNRDDYLGRTIRFEGSFLSTYWDSEVLTFVARPGDGCCGLHGFEVYLNDIAHFDDETWVEVTGILEEFYVEEVNQNFLRLNVTALEER